MNRRLCTGCKKKRYTNKMRYVYYPILDNSFWHCLDCINIADNIIYTDEIIKTKSIEITTTDQIGFYEMNSMVEEIKKIVANYRQNYKITYQFK